MEPIKIVKDLEIYQLAYSLAIEVFIVSKSFPKEEVYSLTDQIKRSSRSIAANISEGFARRKQPNILRNYLLISLGSLEETKTWLDFSKDFGYLSEKDHLLLSGKCDLLGAKIYRFMTTWH